VSNPHTDPLTAMWAEADQQPPPAELQQRVLRDGQAADYAETVALRRAVFSRGADVPQRQEGRTSEEQAGYEQLAAAMGLPPAGRRIDHIGQLRKGERHEAGRAVPVTPPKEGTEAKAYKDMLEDLRRMGVKIDDDGTDDDDEEKARRAMAADMGLADDGHAAIPTTPRVVPSRPAVKPRARLPSSPVTGLPLSLSTAAVGPQLRVNGIPVSRPFNARLGN